MILNPPWNFVARERGTGQIRPFVASQRLYDQWLGLPAPSEGVSAAPFRALCADLRDVPPQSVLQTEHPAAIPTVQEVLDSIADTDPAPPATPPEKIT